MWIFLWLLFVPLNLFLWVWYFKNVKNIKRDETEKEVEKRTGEKYNYWLNSPNYIRATEPFYFKHLLVIILLSILPIANAISFLAFILWFTDDIFSTSLPELIDPNTKFNRFLLNIHKFLNKPL